VAASRERTSYAAAYRAPTKGAACCPPASPVPPRRAGHIGVRNRKQRAAAHRFYGSLGFEPTYDGFKLPL
jgi:hypothetical protein